MSRSRRLDRDNDRERPSKAAPGHSSGAHIGHDLRDGAIPGLSGKAPADSAQPSLLAIQSVAGNRATAQLVVERQAANAEEAKAEPKTPGPIPAGVARLSFRTAGDLEGTSKVPGHEGAIEFASISIETARGEGEQAKSRQLTLTKPHDKTSAVFVKALMSGDLISSATFELIRRNDAGGVDTFFTIEIHDAAVMRLNQSGDMDSITIAFEPSGK